VLDGWCVVRGERKGRGLELEGSLWGLLGRVWVFEKLWGVYLQVIV